MGNSRAGRPYIEWGIAEQGGWLYIEWGIAEQGGWLYAEWGIAEQGDPTLVWEQQSRAVLHWFGNSRAGRPYTE